LGASGIDVSVLGLGSWRTYERMSREQGLAVMRAAREQGIELLDDARYNDETSTAPIPTGYSEVVFGELFRAAGWKRDEVVVTNKLWWEFWPEQSAAEELDASLARMGFDYLDLVYSWSTEEGPPMEEIVDSVSRLIAAGKARAWGTGNWEPEQHASAARIADETGAPRPCAAQLPYNVAARDHVESDATAAALASSNASVVASYVLDGGALTGKYSDPSATGRHVGRLDEPRLRRVVEKAEELQGLAIELQTTAAALAIAFALANERVATVLFGSTTPEQVAENVRAVELLERLTPDELRRLRAVGSE